MTNLDDLTTTSALLGILEPGDPDPSPNFLSACSLIEYFGPYGSRRAFQQMRKYAQASTPEEADFLRWRVHRLLDGRYAIGRRLLAGDARGHFVRHVPRHHSGMTDLFRHVITEPAYDDWARGRAAFNDATSAVAWLHQHRPRVIEGQGDAIVSLRQWGINVIPGYVFVARIGANGRFRLLGMSEAV